MQPVTVVISDRVFCANKTCKDARPLALVIQDGRITQVCDAEHARASVWEGARVLDFGHRFVCPGFHDAHQHVMHAALFPSCLAEEYVGISEQDCVEHMVEFAKKRPGNSWLLCHGWRDNLWDIPKAPTKDSLDRVFPDRPVALYSGDSHTLWVNSCALKKLGLNNQSNPPKGGIFDRDEKGELTGVLREAAGMKYVCEILSLFDQEELQDAYYVYFQKLLRMGITSVCDMAISLIPGSDCILPEVYERLLRQEKLKVRAHLFPTLSTDLSNLEQLQARLTSDMLQAPGFKQFFDGVSSQHTAWVRDDYENARFKGDRGAPTVDAEQMQKLVDSAAQKHHSVRIHTIGDKAVGCALHIFDEAQKHYGYPWQGHNTLEHVEDITASDIEYMARIGLVASVQPPHITIDIHQPERDLGAWRARRMWPFNTMLKAGITLAFGTDAPVVAPNSLDVLWCAITRTDPVLHKPQGGWNAQECISRAEALCAYTYGSACAVGRQHELGSLQEGMFADFVVWDTDLLACDLSEFQAARVEHTFVGGECVYSADVHNSAASL